VLIVGGGDGGMAREALRHPGVEHVTMVEIDAGVIDFSKRFFRASPPAPSTTTAARPRDRRRGRLHEGRGRGFDVIIVDSTDPIGPGEVLFTDTLLRPRQEARLTPGGILVTQNGVPFMQGEELTNTMRAFKALFSDATCYLATIPTYYGGPMAMGWGTDGDARETPVETLRARLAAAGFAPRYYTPEVHKAAFALPGYVATLMP
jgi:spermidine synthase